jgi:hypothetical protein
MNPNSSNLDIMKEEFNLCMNKYIKIMRLKVRFLLNGLYTDTPDGLVVNPLMYGEIKNQVRENSFVSISPDNSSILAIIQKYYPDRFNNEILNTDD